MTSQVASPDITLGGGGIKGFGHIGFLQALEERNLAGGVMLGVSVGALVAALYKNGYSPAQITDEFFNGLERRGTLQLWFKALNSLDPLHLHAAKEQMFDIMNGRGLNIQDVWQNFMACFDPMHMLTGWLPDLLPPMQDMVSELDLRPVEGLRILAYDAMRREPVIFEGEDYDLAVALSASCALPPVFRSVKYRHAGHYGHAFDGALFHRNPTQFSRGTVIVSKLDFADQMPREMLPWPEMYWHMREVFGVSHQQRHDVDENIHVVAEMDTPDVSGLSFSRSPETCMAMIANGLATTRTALDKAFAEGKLH